MRCQRCTFENIPGQKTCIKCGLTLEITATDIDVHPPRMSKWKKPFRGFVRFLRKGKVVPQQELKLRYSTWFRALTSNSYAGLFLSVIPGLGHFIQKRFGEIKWYFLIWLVLLISGLFMYGSAAGFICIGLAVGLHAGIAIQYGIMKDLANVREKVLTVVLVLFALSSIYRFVPGIIIPNLTGGYSGLSIPFYKVQAGDYLLAWGGMDQEFLDRGSLVLIHPVTISSYGTTLSTEEIFGQIVGLGGEQLEIREGFFIVNGRRLDPDQYPVPQWLQNFSFSATIPEDSYFVSTRYNISAFGMRLESSHVRQACFVKADDINARAFMRWWPVARRGFIGYN